MCDDVGCTNIAAFYCKNDVAKLCTTCNERYHSSYGTLFKKHTIVSIKDRPQAFGKCENHKSEDNQFFCTKCKAVLCIFCKINGSHSSGDYANHLLITIGEAYNEAKNQSEAADPVMEKHKGNLRNQLKAVDDKIKIVKDNTAEAEHELYEKLEKALETLHAHAQTKLNILLADQIELRRRYEEIQWAESFLKYQREVLEPQNYLKAWFR